MSDLEARRAANRASMPGIASIVDEFRAAFGESVAVVAGEDFTTGKRFGTLPQPSPNCDACTGHTGGHNGECERMDYVLPGADKPDPARVFCFFRQAKSFRRDEEGG